MEDDIRSIALDRLANAVGGTNLDARESLFTTTVGGLAGAALNAAFHARFKALRTGPHGVIPARFVVPGASLFGFEKGAMAGFFGDLIHQGTRNQ